MSGKRYGVLLITGGRTHQETYAQAFAADKRVRLVGLSDEPDVTPCRRAWNEKLAKQLNIPYIEDISDALKMQNIDIVSICAEPERRGRIAKQCAEARKHLYLDKSLCPRLEEVDALVEAIEKNGIKSHMYTFMTQPWLQRLKQLVQVASLGEIRAIHADCFFAKGHPGSARPTRRHEEYPPERHQLPDAKRELDNVGVYPLAHIHWLAGRKYRRVRAYTANYVFGEHQENNIEDFGFVWAELEGGIQVTVAAGRYGWTTHPAAGLHRYIVVGTHGTYVADAWRPRLEVYTTEMPWTPPAAHPEDPMAFWQSTLEITHARAKTVWWPVDSLVERDVAYFLDCLDMDRESEMSLREAAHIAEVLLAAYKSAATGEIVCLPLPRQ
ncbi:MAG: Gfo/Idh/MocA family oxidoreductase [Gemmatales bacterium]|nr:Gfo/Idh/MocA family oxidoreductase [Gemmatales bacterium]MDW7995498.1 Gfo/Idh/MocA family oxidoreductase [Gemmatales bacterium]